MSSSTLFVLDEDPYRGAGLTELHARKLKAMAEGADIIDCSMINPDLSPPRLLIDALVEASHRPAMHRYAVSRGIRKLREAFVSKYRTAFGVEVDPETEVCVAMGAKDGVMQVLRAVLEPGDVVLIPRPYYPAHPAAVRIVGGRVLHVDIGNDESAFVEAMSRAINESRPRVVLLNSPHNPTGQVLSKEALTLICDQAQAIGAVVINDFVYGELVHGARSSGRGASGIAPSLLGQAKQRGGLVEVYSLSKAYSVPGWRVGAVIGDERIVRRVSKLKSQTDYGIFLPIQHAAAQALTAHDNLVGVARSAYLERAKVFSEGLRAIGWQASLPFAGSSLWVHAVPGTTFAGRVVGGDSESICSDLLDSCGIVASPGVVFGSQRPGDLRFALVHSLDRIAELLRRLSSRTTTEGRSGTGARSSLQVSSLTTAR